ncbi:ea3a01e0-9b37-4408-aaaa-3f4796b0837b [Thermothielavioides terrestris]|uniref:Ea3a01e0-9b37-4408-aaaa-3f4796b0837b n=1 Tax=Thermothielavioides terrestris TaxID=2587410 RepID=A0A3S4BIS4_9PEZI|nr:ea3a01e0-9b37-4408-aaaa-3f4796b0837b [Thermothielavioides terrestris]
MDPGLADQQVEIFTILERACSGLSLVGCVLVISTFSLSKAFHKPINRLVFYATFGNLMTNVATLMAGSFIHDVNSAGCQLQAFLIQMFMPADAFWTLSMAVNVYLTFYFKFDAQRLRKMEIPYLLCCYGIPFIVALVLVFVSTPEKGRMYGNATLWCWIAPDWDVFRIAIFYGPVWIVILITFFIYIRAGRDIYKKRKQLRDFSTSHHEPESHHPPMDDPFSSTKTTEVYVTTEVIDKSGAIDLAPLGGGERRKSQASSPQKPAAYSVTISSNPHGEPRGGDAENQLHTTITAGSQTAGSGVGRSPTTHTHTNKVTTLKSGTGAGHTGPGGVGGGPSNHLRRRAAYEANDATWSYTKCAILFFTAMLVTWIPSSANRVYSVIHPGSASLPLEYMSSFVLPLQGFWNSIIYVVTSWGACKMVWHDIRSWFSRVTGGGGGGARRGLPGHHARDRGAGGVGGVGGIGGGMHRSPFQMMGNSRNGSKASDSSKTYETESTAELAGSRPGSSDVPTMDHKLDV